MRRISSHNTMSNPVTRAAALAVAARAAAAAPPPEPKPEPEVDRFGLGSSYKDRAYGWRQSRKPPPPVLKQKLWHMIPKGAPLDKDYVAQVCAWFYGVTVQDMRSDTRHVRHIKARQACFYWCARLFISTKQETYESIGWWMGKRNHGSVRHACKQYIKQHRVPDIAKRRRRARL